MIFELIKSKWIILILMMIIIISVLSYEKTIALTEYQERYVKCIKSQENLKKFFRYCYDPRIHKQIVQKCMEYNLHEYCKGELYKRRVEWLIIPLPTIAKAGGHPGKK
jgi:hypothetical protein